MRRDRRRQSGRVDGAGCSGGDPHWTQTTPGWWCVHRRRSDTGSPLGRSGCAATLASRCEGFRGMACRPRPCPPQLCLSPHTSNEIRRVRGDYPTMWITKLAQSGGPQTSDSAACDIRAWLCRLSYVVSQPFEAAAGRVALYRIGSGANSWSRVSGTISARSRRYWNQRSRRRTALPTLSRIAGQGGSWVSLSFPAFSWSRHRCLPRTVRRPDGRAWWWLRLEDSRGLCRTARTPEIPAATSGPSARQNC